MERELKDSQNLPTILPKLGLGRHFIVHTQTEIFFFFLIDKQLYIKRAKKPQSIQGDTDRNFAKQCCIEGSKSQMIEVC